MRILVVADEEYKGLWDYYTPDKLEGVDLIISCGDLNSDYLQFLVTMAHCPLLYVHGNHDENYVRKPPLGCECIEDTVYNYKGLRILGLGGSYRYREGDHMYTEGQMSRRIARLSPSLLLMNGFDILVSHAPAKGYGDLPDIPHRGFACFNTLMDRYHPLYMFHGHVHQTYSRDFSREILHPSGTRIVNAYEKCYIDIQKESYPALGETGSGLYDLYIRMKMRGSMGDD